MGSIHVTSPCRESRLACCATLELGRAGLGVTLVVVEEVELGTLKSFGMCIQLYIYICVSYIYTYIYLHPPCVQKFCRWLWGYPKVPLDFGNCLQIVNSAAGNFSHLMDQVCFPIPCPPPTDARLLVFQPLRRFLNLASSK